jgi:cytochrome c oxidase subunit I
MTRFLAAVAAGAGLFLGGTFALRGLVGLQAATVLAYLAALLTFLAVVGGGPALTGYADGKEAPHSRPDWTRFFSFDVDHKVVGVQYVAAALVVFLVGGVMALIMRLELARHGMQFMTHQTYNTVMTLHGIAMVVVALIATAGGLDFGWNAYAPLSTQGVTMGKQMFVLAFLTAGFSSIFSGVNFVATFVTMRAPGMGYARVPIFTWSVVGAAIIQLMGTSVVAASLIMVAFDRMLGTTFFDPALGGNALLYQHLVWFYSHPAVYIMILPAFGAVLEILPVYARKPLFAYRLVAASFMAIVALSFVVWAHHMFTSGMWMLLKLPFMVNTELISIPTGMVFLAALGTLWRSRMRLDAPMLWALAMVANFLIGGLTGIPLADAPTDLHLHDTWFVVAHFHFTIMGGAVFGFFAAFHHWFPKMSGRMLDESLAKIQCGLMFLGFNAVFIPLFWLGNHGMRRNVADFPAWMDPVQTFASAAALIVASSVLVFFYNVWRSLTAGAAAGENPWEAKTLEWKAPSPPPHGNFKTPPVAAEEPYAFGVRS